MTLRASLPVEAVTITPGYSWRLDLDILFDKQRPDDWPDWTVRMHVWGCGMAFSLTPGAGVSFEPVDGLEGAGGPHIIPVIEMTADQTESLRGKESLQYLIDMAAPGETPKDYFSGAIKLLYSPPAELLR